MGFIDRIKNLVNANVNSAKEKVHSLESDEQISAKIRDAQETLRGVEAKIAGAVANESTAKRKVEEAAAEIAKLEKYISESVSDEDKAKFESAKQDAIALKEKAQKAYEQAVANTAGLKEQVGRLTGSISEAEAKLQQLAVRLKTAESEEKSGLSAQQYEQLAENVQKQIDTADAKAALDRQLNEPAAELDDLKKKYDAAPAQPAADQSAESAQ